MITNINAKNKRPRLAIISGDVIGKNMAGPGIRFYEFSKILSEYIDVVLLTPNKVDIDIEGVATRTYNFENHESLRRHVANVDMILIQGHILYHFPFLKNFRGKIIVDLYNPYNFESLEMYSDMRIAERLRIDKNNLNLLKLQMTVGDYFICASKKQRDYWLGMLNAMGRLNPYNYDNDMTMYKLIDIVPFGISSEPPKHTGKSIREMLPNIKEDDKIILWGGGIWNWLDPNTALKALWEITRSRKDFKLVFMGVKHPDPKLPEMQKCIEAIKLSKELGLYGTNVFFNEWAPYEIRQNFLLESNVGLSMHLNKIETHFAYRTRAMDYIWARLPIITTEGDSIARIVRKEKIGEVVRYNDANQLARVLESMLTNQNLREIYSKNIDSIRKNMYWENVARPLVEYCTKSYPAEDKKKIINLINVQNNKLTRIVKRNFERCSNILVITKDQYRDDNLLSMSDIGNVFYLDAEDGLSEKELKGMGEKSGVLDKIGVLKSRITRRTKFDGIIINNSFKDISPKFFYDLLNILDTKLVSDGIIFLSIPESKGLTGIIGEEKPEDRTGNHIDDFTIKYIFENSGFELIDKGILDTIESPDTETEDAAISEIYGKNELFELFEIKLDRSSFRNLKLLNKFNILETEDLTKTRSIKNSIKKYIYLLTSFYFENIRKSYNESLQAINNNIQLQINNEINELNKKNRDRLLLIYYNIFQTLKTELKNMGHNIREINDIIEKLDKKKKKNFNIDPRLDALLSDFENIDRILGLTLTNKYYIAKKL